jgi:tetratricopeptide (TPR) repeat protein
VTLVPKRAGVVTSTTDGEIAIINLESARRRSWSKFFEDPTRSAVAETVVAHEQLALQFVGDVCALDRVAALGAQFAQSDPAPARSALIRAQVASIAHRFADARHYLSQALIGGTPMAEIDRLRLNIDQACGTNLDAVLDARRSIATQSRGLEDFVALGSLLADLRDFAAADRAYRDALRAYQDVSPFPVAGVCFRLGVLWGELAATPDLSRAKHWYLQAIAVLPTYTKACVHLAEIYSSEGRLYEAEELLRRVIACGDPEVDWRLADVTAALGRPDESKAHMQTARSGFDSLLERHLLAFADHGAEFYAGSGNDLSRALDLAHVNIANRPTLRAFEQGYAIALSASDDSVASEVLAAATKRWGSTAAFRRSSLAPNGLQGAAA